MAAMYAEGVKRCPKNPRKTGTPPGLCPYVWGSFRGAMRQMFNFPLYVRRYVILTLNFLFNDVVGDEYAG
jgi:hypothetical protein